MGMNDIKFNGQSLNRLGFAVRHFPIHSAARRSREFIPIIGRNGDVINDNGRYENVEFSYEVNTVFITRAHMELTHSFIQGRTRELIHSFTQACTRELIHSFTRAHMELTHSFTQGRTRELIHSFTEAGTQELIHSFTQADRKSVV